MSLDAIYRERQRRWGGSDLYSPFNPGHLFMIQGRQRAVLAMLREQGFAPLTGRSVLELGCGAGGVLHEYLGYGVDPERLHGVELLGWRLTEAQARLPHLPLTCADGQLLPYADASFDLVCQYTVFTSVVDAGTKRRLAQEMMRVTRPGGAILWYDYWINPVNRDVKAIGTAEIRSLFPGARLHLRRITLAPPLARWLAGRSWLLAGWLEATGLFNTHYLGWVTGDW
jgi:SAM-dependent methyltransferase